MESMPNEERCGPQTGTACSFSHEWASDNITQLQIKHWMFTPQILPQVPVRCEYCHSALPKSRLQELFRAQREVWAAARGGCDSRAAGCWPRLSLSPKAWGRHTPAASSIAACRQARNTETIRYNALQRTWALLSHILPATETSSKHGGCSLLSVGLPKLVC